MISCQGLAAIGSELCGEEKEKTILFRAGTELTKLEECTSFPEQGGHLLQGAFIPCFQEGVRLNRLLSSCFPGALSSS